MENRKLLEKLDTLQKSLTNGKWPMGAEPHDDYFTNFVIEDLRKPHRKDPIQYCYEEISASLAASDSTCYTVEYAAAYQRVYEYLVTTDELKDTLKSMFVLDTKEELRKII